MRIHQRLLLDLLSGQDPHLIKNENELFLSKVKISLEELATTDLAELYADSGLFQTFLKFLGEQCWLVKNKNTNNYKNFADIISPFLKFEFASHQYLHELLEHSSTAQIKIFAAQAKLIELRIVEKIKSSQYDLQKSFSRKALELISELFAFEHQLQLEKTRRGQDFGLSLYRTFDSLDEILGLDYLADKGMKVDLENTERLYEGAGVGVQSGYSTVLTALRHLNPDSGSRFIDLGSGYGRIGLIVGLLRPDIDFIGYEFVQHRVDIAKSTVENFEMQNHVHFYAQDLSSKNFQIPEAEIYYLYDPFSQDTYDFVLSQIIQISTNKRITIATKGNARHQLLKIAQKYSWPSPDEFDSGNLCLFHSQ